MNKTTSKLLTTVATLLFSVLLGIVLITVSSRDKDPAADVMDQLSRDTTTTTAATKSTAYFGYSITANVPQTIRAGQSIGLAAQTTPHTPGVDILWYCSDSSVATVTLNGMLTGISAGTVTLTATAIDPDNYSAPSCSFELTVLEGSNEIGSVPEGNRLLMIANSDAPLDSGYLPELVEVGEHVPTLNNGIMLTRAALVAYIRMYEALRQADVGELYIISGYRSFERQTELFENKTNEFLNKGYFQKEAERKAAQTVNPPGASEHQLGVSIDVSTDGNTQHNFHRLPQGKWIAQNAHLYGFVIRYPENKTTITRISYEPWHLRYVGIVHAQYMYSHDLCLEEYVRL